MRHQRVVASREHRRAFRRALYTAALASTAAAVLGYAVASSPLVGWAALGIAGAVAASLWLESRAGRTATPPPIARLSLFGARGED